MFIAELKLAVVNGLVQIASTLWGYNYGVLSGRSSVAASQLILIRNPKHLLRSLPRIYFLAVHSFVLPDQTRLSAAFFLSHLIHHLFVSLVFFLASSRIPGICCGASLNSSWRRLYHESPEVFFLNILKIGGFLFQIIEVSNLLEITRCGFCRNIILAECAVSEFQVAQP